MGDKKYGEVWTDNPVVAMENSFEYCIFNSDGETMTFALDKESAEEYLAEEIDVDEADECIVVKIDFFIIPARLYSLG